VNTLQYLYGIVPGDAPAPGPSVCGVDDAPLALLRVGELAAVVSPVDASIYAEDTLDEKLADLGWVGRRGLAHERVLTWFVDRVPTVPLRPFSLHHDEDRVVARVRQQEAAFRQALARLADRREWGIKLWRAPAAADHIAAASDELRELDAEIEAAAAGRRFLLAKKRASRVQEVVRRATSERARSLFSALRAVAEESVSLPIAAGDEQGARFLVLHAAFLVHQDGFSDFQLRVSEQAHQAAAVGFEIEFTGPWPAYHFVGMTDV
jgi:hypothetical protein